MKFTGAEIPRLKLSSSNTVMIRYHTDEKTHRRHGTVQNSLAAGYRVGFLATYSAKEGKQISCYVVLLFCLFWKGR